MTVFLGWVGLMRSLWVGFLLALCLQVAAMGYNSSACLGGDLYLAQCTIANGVGVLVTCNGSSISACNATACNTDYALAFDTENSLYQVGSEVQGHLPRMAR